MSDSKTQRTNAKRLLTRAQNRIKEAILANVDIEIIQQRFSEITLLRRDVESKHEEFISSLENATEDAIANEDQWLDSIEEEFSKVELMKLDYDRKIRNSLVDVKEDITLLQSTSVDTETSVNKIIRLRSMEEILFKNAISNFFTIQKSPNVGALLIKESYEDIKVNFNRCKDLQSQLIVSLDRDLNVEETNWITKLQTCLTEVNIAFGKHLKQCEDNLQERKKDMSIPTDSQTISSLKLQPLKMPMFDGNVRNYPVFKKDFNTLIAPRMVDDLTNSYVLKSCLTEAAAEIVKNLDKTNEIWLRLDERFGRPSKLIDTVMNDLKSLELVTEDDDGAFLVLVDTVERAHRDLCIIGVEKEISNSSCVSLIEAKLPKSIRREWSKTINLGDLMMSKDLFPHLLKFLHEQRKIIEYETSCMRNITDAKDGAAHHVDINRNCTCWVHDTNGHTTEQCRVFKDVKVEERVKMIKEKRACWSCLELGHRYKDCEVKKKCSEPGCEKNHHPLLHEASQLGLILHAVNKQNETHISDPCLLQLMEIESSCGTPLNVLWDAGATVSLITFEKAKELDLKGKRCKLSIAGVGGKVEGLDSFIYNLNLQKIDGSLEQFTVYGVNQISSVINYISLSRLIPLFHGLTEGEVRRPQGNIDILIGYDYAAFHPKVLESVGHLLLLYNNFGKCISGRHPLVKEKTLCNSTSVNAASIKVTVDDFFALESLGISCSPRCGNCKCGTCPIGSNQFSIKDEREYRMIEEGLKLTNGVWMASYPWLKDPHELPNNEKKALALLYSSEKRLLKTQNKERAALYLEMMNDMVTRGVARLVSDDELNAYDGPVHYILPHEVMRTDSVSTPCRIVFNTSSNYLGHVLNEYWAKGPDLLINLLGLLLRFREGLVAFTGDISKMYHVIKLSMLDQHTHRYKWRSLNISIKPQTYVMTSVSFGDKPAATISAVALRKTAEMNADKYVVASQTLLTNTYVDDIIESKDSLDECKQLAKEIEMVLGTGNFRIKEWYFTGEGKSSKEFINQSCPEVLADVQKVLGVSWEKNLDILKFVSNKVELPKVMSKRWILSQINSIHDPPGLLAAFTIRAKILMKRLWVDDCKGLSWDDPVPPDRRDEWCAFFRELEDIDKISFPRCIKSDGCVGDPYLIIFCDGSEDAYGACAYVHWKTKDNKTLTRLFAAKSRVTPVKMTTIVRIELAGALLASRLCKFIKKESRLKFSKTFILTDSQIVFSMIQSESYGFATYTAVRVGEIRENSDPTTWYWIRGDDNIADWVSRGKGVVELCQSGSWQRGPDFLRLPEEDWPVSQLRSALSLPDKVEVVMKAEIAEADCLVSRICIEKFSLYMKLIRVTARVLLLYSRNPKVSLFNAAKTLFKPDLIAAERFWIYDAQKVLQEDFMKGRFNRLSARKRDDGIIIVGCRVDAWIEMSFDNDDVILLPASHRLSYLYVLFIHNLSHSGVATTASKVRRKFWINGIQRIAKSIIHHCVTCKKERKILREQVMAPLPVQRLKPAPPWYFISLDYFGPFDIKGEVNQRTQSKGYAIIFNCMLVRAVHIELCPKTCTDTFLLAFRRFVATRGYPKEVFSDGGPQLKSADKELQLMIKSLDWIKIQQYGAEEGIKWHFTPGESQWMNGCSEALVKSAKRAIKQAVGVQVMTYSELSTVFAECSNLLNERPIGKHPQHPDDGKYLSPNDLLLGRSSNSIPSGPFENISTTQKRMKFVQVVDSFWRRWTRDYFPSLIVQAKWHTDRRNVMIGDVVIMKDDKAVRGHWRMAKVTKVTPSGDGKVRRVTVSYKSQPEAKGFIHVDRSPNSLVIIVPKDGES